MTDPRTKIDNLTTVPSATPSDDEIRFWNTLPRDKQLERMQKALGRAINGARSVKTMDQIKAEALAKIAARKHG